MGEFPGETGGLVGCQSALPCHRGSYSCDYNGCPYDESRLYESTWQAVVAVGAHQAEPEPSCKTREGVCARAPCAGLHQLESHAEVVMLDFAASLLAELEKWMSSASTAMVNMSSYADSEAFIGPTSVVEEVHKRLYTDEVRGLSERLRRSAAAKPERALPRMRSDAGRVPVQLNGASRSLAGVLCFSEIESVCCFAITWALCLFVGKIIILRGCFTKNGGELVDLARKLLWVSLQRAAPSRTALPRAALELLGGCVRRR